MQRSVALIDTLVQARSKHCLIGPAITKLLAGGLAQIGIQALLSREQKLSSIVCGVGVPYETLPVNPALCFISPTVLSPTSRSWCYPTTSDSDFLSLSSTTPPSPSLFCPHSILLFSSQYLPIQLQTTFLRFLG